MSRTFRLTEAAQDDLVAVLTWSHETFGADARRRYEALIAAAFRDAADCDETAPSTKRPGLGQGVFLWYLAWSRPHTRGGNVRRPRHFLVCRRAGDVLVIGRILHDSMDVPRHLAADDTWT